MHPDKELSHATLDVPARSPQGKRTVVLIGALAAITIIVIAVLMIISANNSKSARDSQSGAGTVNVNPSGYNSQTVKISPSKP